MARRRAAGPRKRWFDEIEKFFIESKQFQGVPGQKQVWDDLEEEFVRRT